MKRIILVFILVPFFLFSQFNTEYSFIKNKGQFDNRNWKNNKIEYAVDYNNSQIFFSKTGVSYRFDKIIRNPNWDKNNPSSTKRTNISELINIKWIGANENVEIIPEVCSPDYYSYAIKNSDIKTVINENNIKAYKKITYKNIYNGIDIEYVINKKSGVKYSVIIHPGGDASKIKMKYSNSHTNVSNENIIYGLNKLGDFYISTSLSEIIEHRPNTFYKNSKKAINSRFSFENEILAFNIENYDNSKEIVIDPWIESPSFTNSNAVWEVETDAFGNVYAIGGESPMKLKKYNSAGALQWTYSTPWDTSSVWLGTLATDNNGNSYITSGTNPEIECIDNAGNMLWHNASSLNQYNEYWSITFNYDTTKIIVGGTYNLNPIDDYYSAILELDINNGNELSHILIDTTNVSGYGSSPVEVRSICSSKNGDYVFLTHKDIGSLDQNFSNCTLYPNFKVENKVKYAYKAENYLPISQNGGPLKALTVNNNYIYIHKGDSILKFDLETGQFITSVQLLGGECELLLFTYGNVVHNCGLDVDSCGNVYAGSGDRVVKFDEDLNVLAEQLLSFSVYDVDVNNNGEVIAIGAEENNEEEIRNGKIQSVNFNACQQYKPINESSFICASNNVCIYDSIINLSAEISGGIWSGDGVVDSVNGFFNPSIAGLGSHLITYVNQLNTDSINIFVSACDSFNICRTDSLIISNSNISYWYNIENTFTLINNEQDCISCQNATPIYMLTPPNQYDSCSSDTCFESIIEQIGTGNILQISDITTWPIKASDLYSDTIINSINSIPMCDDCTPQLINLGNDTTICQGDSIILNAGSFVNYLWNDSSLNQTIVVYNTGEYNVVAIDSNMCTSTDTILIDFETCTNINIKDNFNEINIFPNPTSTLLNVKSEKYEVEKIEILDITGKIIYNISVNNLEYKIHVSELKNGIYFINIFTNGEKHIAKFIKQ